MPDNTVYSKRTSEQHKDPNRLLAPVLGNFVVRKNRTDGSSQISLCLLGVAASILSRPLFNDSSSLSLSAPIKSALKRVPAVHHLHLSINCLTVVVHNNGFHSVNVYSASGPPTLGGLHTLAHFTPTVFCMRCSLEYQGLQVAWCFRIASVRKPV